MNQDMQPLGRGLIVMGALVMLGGVLLMAAGKMPWLGRLPGDIRVERPGFSFYFPIGTCIALSALMSLVVWIAGRFRQ